MKVYIYGKGTQAEQLHAAVAGVLEDLGLTDFIQIENTQDPDMKDQLQITEDFALVIEEESINFKDMIFEGMIPAEEEIKSMFISIMGGGSGGGCAPGGCGSGCSC